MKKLFYFLIFALAFVACGNEPDAPIDKGKLDPNAMITLRGKTVGKSSSAQKAHIYGLTPLEVVQNAVNIKWQSHWFDNGYYEVPFDIIRGFIDEHKDFEKPALLMWGTDIITQNGEFYKDFIYGYNVYITNGNDTIAHVPDSIINNARPLIEAAYNDNNYTEVYRLFNEAFIFIPLNE